MLGGEKWEAFLDRLTKCGIGLNGVRRSLLVSRRRLVHLKTYICVILEKQGSKKRTGGRWRMQVWWDAGL